MDVSFVIPCYNSENSILSVIERIELVMQKIDMHMSYEFILINDCSKDHTYDVITALSHNKENVKGINLEKNCGQHNAIMAGLNRAAGDYVVVSDDDGQTPIENLPLMFQKMDEGYDAVSAKYNERNQPSWFRKFGTKMNDLMASWLIQCPPDVSVSVFLVMKHYIVKEICKYKGPYPYIAGLLLRTTQNIGNVEMEQLSRKTGKSGYSVKKLISLWFNGFTSFSIKPLRIATGFGLLSSFAGMVYALTIIFRRLVFNNIQAGWSSLTSIILVLGGIILFCVGLIGEYIGRIYLSINGSPQYVVKSCTWEDDPYVE